MDERAFIQQFEAADAQEMARILARPTSDQATALRLYLGDERYERMHATALDVTANASRRGYTTPSKGRVVAIHGIMGAELSNFRIPRRQRLLQDIGTLLAHLPRLGRAPGAQLRRPHLTI
jgi:hypothetical protein